MPIFKQTTLKEAKKRQPRKNKEDEGEFIDYSKIPGIVILKNQQEYENFILYGQKTKPKVK